MLALNILLLINFLIIAYQDIKDRLVWWWLFLTVGILSGILHYTQTISQIFWLDICINTLLITGILFVLYLYSRFILKKNFLKEAFGLGDVVLFYALSIGLPPVSFTILFIFSVFFSLIFHFTVKKRSKHLTVPLAGYISLFFGVVYFCHIAINFPTLYQV